MIGEIFSNPEGPRPWWKVIAWWEIRRIPYNIIVGVVGFISLMLFFLFIDLAHELKPGEDAVEPMALFAAPILLNICYTAGWICELFLRLVWREKSPVVGPTLFKLGLSASLFAAVLPALMWFFIWIVRSN